MFTAPFIIGLCKKSSLNIIVGPKKSERVVNWL